MSKYVRGVKRNQTIQRWPHEVFPTKKEGKYIVKLRENKIDESITQNENVTQEVSVESTQESDSTFTEGKGFGNQI